jgi:hypothetical protein
MEAGLGALRIPSHCPVRVDLQQGSPYPSAPSCLILMLESAQTKGRPKPPHRTRHRRGSVHTFHIGVADKVTVQKIVTDNVARESRLHTDESRLYTGADALFASQYELVECFTFARLKRRRAREPLRAAQLS